MLRVWLARVVALFRRSRGEDLDEEIRAHLRMAVDENRRRGMSPKDALRAARLSFGSVDSTIEACRDQRGVPVIETIVRDFRFALRGLIRRPLVSTVAVLTLSLGLASVTVLFAVTDSVILQPIGDNDSRLVRIWTRSTRSTLTSGSHWFPRSHAVTRRGPTG